MKSGSIQHNFVAANVYRALYGFVTARKLGCVFTGGLIYILHYDPETGIRLNQTPDGSFLRQERLHKDLDLSQPFTGAPDLAIEVISLDDMVAEVFDRIGQYLTYGTEQAWVLFPAQGELHQYVRGEGTIHVFKDSDTLPGGTLLPGLSLFVGDLFELPGFRG